MSLKVVQLSLLGFHLMPIYVCCLLTDFHEFGCCFFVVLLILGIHFLQLLVTSHYVFHCDSLPLGRYVGFPLLTQSCVEFSLTAEVLVLFSKPILLVIEILLFSGGHLISHPVGMHRPCEVLLCLVLFSLKLFHSIFHHHPFHLLFFLNQFGLELLGRVLDLNLLNGFHSHLR